MAEIFLHLLVERYTIDIDAMQIVAEKREARYTYKGEKGYIPLVPIDRHAASSGTGFVRGQVVLPLSRHRQQSHE